MDKVVSEIFKIAREITADYYEVVYSIDEDRMKISGSVSYEIEFPVMVETIVMLSEAVVKRSWQIVDVLKEVRPHLLGFGVEEHPAKLGINRNRRLTGKFDVVCRRDKMDDSAKKATIDYWEKEMRRFRGRRV